MNYETKKVKWEKRRLAIRDAVHKKGRSVRDVANAYGLTTQRVYAILGTKEKK